MPADLVMLGQDPRLGGGALSEMEAFCRGATALGRTPSLYYLGYRGVRQRAMPAIPVASEQLGAVLDGADALNQMVAGIRVAPRIRDARSLWVVSTVASHGYGAVRSRRPFGCWVSTTITAESRVRTPGLTPLRRAVLRTNVPALARLERRVLRAATVVCATSASSRREIVDATALDERRIRLLPVPVDVDTFRPVADGEWRENLQRPLLLFVGRASDPRKNVGVLLEAFREIRRSIPEARLRLVGEPPRIPVGVGVEVVGHVASVAAQLREASLLVLPSLQEGFGVVVAEALAAGVPVVTTPSGGPEDLVRDSGGGRVLTGFSPEELARIAVELLQDEPALTEMRRRGREHVVAEYSFARFTTLLAEAFQELDG